MVRPFVLYKNRKKAACANKLWLVPQNVIGLDIWLFWQLKLVVRALKKSQNRQNVGLPLVRDAIYFALEVCLTLTFMLNEIVHKMWNIIRNVLKETK